MTGSSDDGKAAHGLREGALGQVLGYQLAQASISTRRLFEKHIGSTMQLKPVEFTMLLLLLVNDDVTQKRLCATLSVSPPNLTILLDRMQQRELVTRVRSETDRRSQQIHLTRKGLALAKKAQEISLTMEHDLMRHLSPVEKAMLIELLQKVSRHRKT
jgi:DNA-binding MarR family transcriptional regulator